MPTRFIQFFTALFLLSVALEAQAVLTRDQLNQRLSLAIAASMKNKVVLDDVLGEGPTGWDSDPRYPKGTVNCMIWLQLVLSEAYSARPEDKTAIMDAIRYYEATPAFSLRKHYVDHWVNVEPGPLRRVNVMACGFPYYAHVRLEPKKFLRQRKFSCPLYRMDEHAFELQYVRHDGLDKCQAKLPPGFYVLFAVPSEKYTQTYLQDSGPMGLVHSLILEIQGGGKSRVYHASTAAKAVLSETLGEFLDRMKNLHIGYLVFELDPAWDYRKPALLTPEARRLLECESRLPAGMSH